MSHRSVGPRCHRVFRGSRDDADEKFILGIQQIHRRALRLGRNGIEGVSCLRAIDCHDQDVATALCKYSVRDDSPKK